MISVWGLYMLTYTYISTYIYTYMDMHSQNRYKCVYVYMYIYITYTHISHVRISPSIYSSGSQTLVSTRIIVGPLSQSICLSRYKGSWTIEFQTSSHLAHCHPLNTNLKLSLMQISFKCHWTTPHANMFGSSLTLEWDFLLLF